MVENRKDKETSYLGEISKCVYHKYCPPTFHELRRREFEELHQRKMTASEYEIKFLKLSKYCKPLITNDEIKRQDLWMA